MVYPVIERGFWVKFDTDGGSHVQSVFCEPGKTLTLSQVPTRSGYTFDGWYDADGNSVTTVSETATVTAHWTASNNTKYTVIHWLENADDDEYTLDGTETKTGTTGSETNAAAKSYTGFTADPITQETIAGDGSTIVNVYYKRVVYEVKFMGLTCNKEEHTHGVDCWGWCHKKEHTHNENCYTEITGLIIRAKHGANISKNWPTYQGSSTWAVNPTGGPYQVNIDTMPMGGDTFYGPKTGQGSETAYYYVEALPGASNTVTVDGIKYVLHHSDTSPGTGYHITDEDKYPITGFKFETFNAKWGRDGYNYNNAKFYYTRNSYDITFINNGSTDDTKNFKYEASIADAYYVPNHPSEIDASYTFAGWYDNKLCEGEPFVFTGKTMPATGITLYAKWQAPQVNATVYLSASADSESKTFSVPYGKKITESDDFNAIIAHIKAETGEAPSAWFVVTGEGRVLFDLDTPLYSSVTLYPFFASSSEGYTVTYKEEGTDEPAKDEQKYLTGSRAGILAPVNGENFRAWKMEDGKLIHPGDKITVTKNITLTAVYTIKPQTETITYHYNFTDKDGSYKDDIFEDGNHPKNTNAKVLTLSAAGFELVAGYEFLGWALTANGSITYQPGDEAFVDGNDDNDLWAVWSRKSYKVTWLDEDGSLLREDTVKYGEMPEYGENPTKTATDEYTYTFDKWTPELEAVTKDATYQASYKAEAIPTPTPIPSEEPTPTPTPTPTPAPTEEPTPTPAPAAEPTSEPTTTPTATPSAEPTAEPTTEPTATPTAAPTATPAPNPNPATPTPTPVAPVVPATVATPTPKPTATPSTTPSDNGGKGDGNNDGEIGETINDNETPLANGEDIADNATPLAGLGTGAWALINLILTIVTTLLSILLLIGYIGKKKKALEDEDGNVVLDENGKEVMEYEKNKKGLWRLISIIPALIAIIVFIFTEDMTLPMIFVDKWTILHVVIALVQVVVMVLCKKKKDENGEDENAANA